MTIRPPQGLVARLALATLLAIVLSGALPARGAPARVPPDFVGLVSEDVFAAFSPYRIRTLARQTAVGSRLLRQSFDWAAIERSPGKFRWRKYDSYVLMCARFRVRILAILFNVPPWLSTAPSHGARHGTYPPKNMSDFADFARQAVERYGPNGSLWKANPRVPKVPIKSWQIWNEPNLQTYWASGVSPAGYVKLLRAASEAIRAADPTAEVVTAGIPQSRLGVPLLKYLASIYNNDAKGLFDTVALNPYARTPKELYDRLRAARRVMNRYGDTESKIWITELGWSDRGPKSPFRVGPEKQADLITKSFAMIGRQRERLNLRGVIYAFWRDGKPYPPQFKDFWGLHTGLFLKNGKPKRAYSAFVHATRRLRRS